MLIILPEYRANLSLNTLIRFIYCFFKNKLSHMINNKLINIKYFQKSEKFFSRT